MDKHLSMPQSITHVLMSVDFCVCNSTSESVQAAVCLSVCLSVCVYVSVKLTLVEGVRCAHRTVSAAVAFEPGMALVL